jgi:hypothetical protein
VYHNCKLKLQIACKLGQFLQKYIFFLNIYFDYFLPQIVQSKITNDFMEFTVILLWQFYIFDHLQICKSFAHRQREKY